MAAFGLLLLATLAAYAPALRGGFLWDDDRYVADNKALRSLEGLGRIWLDPAASDQYYPLVFTSFWLEYRLWGLRPEGYHAVNIILHALNAWLLLRLLRRLQVPGAVLAAAVFALHPVHVESVAWITERKNVLSGSLYLGAALALVRYLGLSPAGIGKTPDATPRTYLLALGLFLLALLGKTATASLPAAMLLLVWWRRGRIDGPSARAMAPFFILGAAGGLVTALLEQGHVGARGAEWNLTPVERCLVAGRAMWFYLGKLVWPARLTFIYPRWTIDSSQPEQYLFPLAIAAAGVALVLLRGRIGRGPLCAALYFAGTLAPALGFFNVYAMRFSFVADHFQYLASLGAIVGISASAAVLATRQVKSPAGRRVAQTCAGLIVCLLGVLCFRQAGVYRDVESLWKDTIAKNDGAWIAHNNLGLVHRRAGRLAAAKNCYERAAGLNPSFFEAHYNLANALRDLGRAEEALERYREAVRLRPDYVDALYNLGHLLVATGRPRQAVTPLQELLKIHPQDRDAHYKLGDAFAACSENAMAEAHYRHALRLRPACPYTHRKLGDLLLAAGRAEEAMTHLAESVRLRPDYITGRMSLAGALEDAGRRDEAAKHYREVLRLRRDHAEARRKLERLDAQPEPVGRPSGG
jgi:tetratricopeptide (TPR) repeat protein